MKKYFVFSFFSTEKEKCSRAVLCVYSKIFTSPERKSTRTNSIFTEVFLGYPNYIFSFILCIACEFEGLDIFFYLETLFLDRAEELLNFVNDFVLGFIVKCSESTLYPCTFANHIKSFSSMENGECTSKLSFFDILKIVNIIFHLSMEPNALPDSDLQTFGRTTVSTITYYIDSDWSRAGHYWAFFAPDVPEFSNRPIMESINFIYPFQTSLLYHKLCSIGCLLCRLKKQPDFFIFRNVRFFLQK